MNILTLKPRNKQLKTIEFDFNPNHCDLPALDGSPLQAVTLRPPYSFPIRHPFQPSALRTSQTGLHNLPQIHLVALSYSNTFAAAVLAIWNAFHLFYSYPYAITNSQKNTCPLRSRSNPTPSTKAFITTWSYADHSCPPLTAIFS